MNAFLQPQQLLEETFKQVLVQKNFEALFMAHVAFFQKHQQASFSYTIFAAATARCHAPIENYQHLLHYISLYGYAHFQRFSYLIEQALQAGMCLENTDTLRISDYGCGQGIATLACLELLQDKLKNFKKIEIVLIEPSELALGRAKQWVTAQLQKHDINFTIKAHASSFDDLVQCNHYTDGVALHLFSNVLDVYSSNRFSMKKLVALTKVNFKHNYYLAISPDYYSGNIGFDAFLAHLKPEQIFVQTRCSTTVHEYNSYYRSFRTRTTPVHALVCYQSVKEKV